MTIKIYPSRLEGEPLEVHETEQPLFISEWIKSVAPSFSIDAKNLHPTITVNGSYVPHENWGSFLFYPDDLVLIYIEARGWVLMIGAGIIGGLVGGSMSKPGSPNSRQSSTMGTAGLLANQVRWGDPIPEIAGAPLSYPDYIAPPRRYYSQKTQQWVDSLVCIGVGSYVTDLSQVYVGDTSFPSLGDDGSITFYGPGETISADHRAWWHTPEEVGFTTVGGSGMTLGPESDVQPNWTNNITFLNQNIIGNIPVPDSWEPGMILRVIAEHELIFDGDSVQSSLLDTMNLSVSDEIEITGTHAGLYIISSITPGTGGNAGSPSVAFGSSPPSRLDFGVTQAEIIITIGSNSYGVLLNSNESSINSLVNTLNFQLISSRVSVTADSAGVLSIVQDSPYTGESITVTGDVADLFGVITSLDGDPAIPASGAKYHVAGANFGNGTEIAGAGISGLLYSIVSISGNTLVVNPGSVVFWSGFPSGISNSTSFVSLDPGSQEGGWVGPFAAVPRGEVSDAFEVDIFYPNGLIHYTSKGYWRDKHSSGVIAWRYIGETSWNNVPFSHVEQIPDQIGFTIRVTPPTPGRFEVRVRSDGASSGNDKKQWTGLRSRIIGAPSSYPGLTTAHVRIRTGDKISGNVENKIAIRALRVLPTVEDENVVEQTRDIVPFFIYMMSTVGYGRDMLDMPTLQALHSLWQSRGDTFDLSINSDSTLKTVANYCLGAGFGELTLKRGKISAVRDSLQSGVPTRIYSPQEMTGALVETSQSVMPDDIDGVDVEYVDYLTGKTLTVSYRLPNDLGLRVESIKAPGVTSRRNAWRIAARSRRISAYRRTTFTGATELAAMSSYYWDYVGIQDGIPDYGQSAFVVSSVGANEFILSEPVIFVGGSLFVRIRLPDGTASEPIDATYDGHHVTLDFIPAGVVISSDPNNPTVFYLGQNIGIAHNAFMTSVSPDGNGKVSFEAVKYDARVYEEDDNSP